VVNWQYLLFTETWRHSMLVSRFCKIRGEKHPRAFVKVVEGSGIYNFLIHHFVHFYSKFWRFLRSNSGTVNFCRAGDAAPCRAPCARAPAPRLPRRPVPPRRIPRSRTFPRARAPRPRSTPRRLEVAQATRPAPFALWAFARAARRACHRPRVPLLRG
jgi:hypothetical protein